MKTRLVQQLLTLFLGIQLCLVAQKCFRYLNPESKPKKKVTFSNNVQIKPTVNIATRGIEDYRQIGYLDGIESDMMLPLFGRRVYRGASMWNYYAMTNDRFPIKIPIEKENRGCLDEYGCKEIYDGDKVYISEYNSNFNARVYKRTIRYNPFT